MNDTYKRIWQALSLRTPQKESLEILSQIADILSLEKDDDAVAALKKVRELYPNVESFERDFPSLCFALATGVGKTRLMGAFISYLFIEKGLKHFFVLAPNLTIYRKLIADFTPNTPKYVFKGIPQFAQNQPQIITGDDYQHKGPLLDNPNQDTVQINIFNISKINSDKDSRGTPRVRRISEYLGESYFDYLAGLDDLVLLMDEAHRYRAKAGMKAINELKPVLGIELTATPQIETAKSAKRFKNIIYDYPLAKAMADGYVKHPAVVGRSDFKKNHFSDDQLEKLKLLDGVRVHEETKTDLVVYAENNEERYVKPFMLVIAKDTTHAEELKPFLESNDFEDGIYGGKVIVVHSAQKGEEKDETVEKLLAVEDPNEPTEIVIHVNMLKEGWDVNNLYTIVPLRKADSRTLVEQSIGRGLRLPYGRHTGEDSIDRVNIVAHDKFDEIVTEAKSKHFSFQKIYVDEGGLDKAKKPKRIQSTLERELGLTPQIDPRFGKEAEKVLEKTDTPAPKQEPVCTTPAEQEIAKIALQVIEEQERVLPNSEALKKEDVKAKIAAEVKARHKLTKKQDVLDFGDGLDIEKIVAKTAEKVTENTIDIPRVAIVPKNIVDYSFDPFKIDFDTIGKPEPLDQKIVVKSLGSDEMEEIETQRVGNTQEDLKDYILATLSEKNGISYSRHAAILHDLSEQVVAHLHSYLTEEDAIVNVLHFHGRDIADKVFEQMKKHFRRGKTEYEARVLKGFMTLKGFYTPAVDGETVYNFRDEVQNKAKIKSMRFHGFKKCLYEEQKFDSNTERQFSETLEETKTVEKWFKPNDEMAKRAFQIFYDLHGKRRMYCPDFVVETGDIKYLIETKKAKEVSTEEVQAKKTAAIKWCEHANTHAKETGDKPWVYILIPHDEIRPSASFDGLVSRFKT